MILKKITVPVSDSTKVARIKKYYGAEDLEYLQSIKDKKYASDNFINRRTGYVGHELPNSTYTFPDSWDIRDLNGRAFLAGLLHPTGLPFTEVGSAIQNASPEFKQGIDELIQEKANATYKGRPVRVDAISYRRGGLINK